MGDPRLDFVAFKENDSNYKKTAKEIPIDMCCSLRLSNGIFCQKMLMKKSVSSCVSLNSLISAISI